MIHEDDIKWRFVHSLNMRNQHHTVLRDNELGVQVETLTNKTCGGYGLGRARSFYYIDNDPREFLSSADLANAYNEKFKFSEENPEHEVSYVKVIKKRNIDKP